MILETLPDVQILSALQKRQLAEELFDEVLPRRPLTPDDDAPERLLDARVQSRRNGKEPAAPWSEVWDRLNEARRCVRL